jgi:(p)ppGpp synthase/HD superfamily hydrolase
MVDFAYDVHTDLGNHCMAAKVNHELVPLRTVLKNGDRVEILTSPTARPNPAWLDYVMTSKARANIRSFLKNQKLGESLKLGARLLDKALAPLGTRLDEITPAQCAALLENLRLPSWDALLSEIGLGNRVAAVVARQLVPASMPVEPEEESPLVAHQPPTLAIRGTEGVVVTYARCCRPIPGDPILGFLSAGKGIVIHTEDCPNVGKYRKHPEQWLDVQWEPDIAGVFPVSFRVEVRNQRGVLASVAAAIAQEDANIDSVNFDDRDGQFTAMDFTIEVRNRIHLAQILRRVRALETVVRINRMKG